MEVTERKLERGVQYDLAVSLLGIYATNIKRYISPHVHCSTTFNSQDMEKK